jgi:hypothetical protein
VNRPEVLVGTVAVGSSSNAATVGPVRMPLPSSSPKLAIVSALDERENPPNTLTVGETSGRSSVGFSLLPRSIVTFVNRPTVSAAGTARPSRDALESMKM